MSILRNVLLFVAGVVVVTLAFLLLPFMFPVPAVVLYGYSQLAVAPGRPSRVVRLVLCVLLCLYAFGIYAVRFVQSIVIFPAYGNVLGVVFWGFIALVLLGTSVNSVRSTLEP